jgi:hypothetical protein
MDPKGWRMKIKVSGTLSGKLREKTTTIATRVHGSDGLVLGLL